MSQNKNAFDHLANEVLAGAEYDSRRVSERAAKKAAKRAAKLGKHTVSKEVEVPVQSRVAQVAERIHPKDYINAPIAGDAVYIANQLSSSEDELRIGGVAMGFKNVSKDPAEAYGVSQYLSGVLGTKPVWSREGSITAEAAAFPVIDLAKLYEQTSADFELSASDKYSTLAKVGGNALLLHADGITHEVVQAVPNVPGAFQVNTLSAAGFGEGHVMYPEEIGVVVISE